MGKHEEPNTGATKQSSAGCWVMILLAVLVIASLQSPSPPPPHPLFPTPEIEPSDEVVAVHRSFREPFDANEKKVPAIAEQLAKFANWAYDKEDQFFKAAGAAGFPKSKRFGLGSTVVYVSTCEDIGVVSFRGTDDWGDWLINLETSSKPVAELGAIHAGFDNAYQSVRNDIDQHLKVANVSSIWITGHSLGGALSLCCALQHVLDPKLKGIVTFGQPMVVDKKLAAFLDGHLKGKFIHYVNGQDIVPRVPPGFRHCGSLAWFKNGDVEFDSRLFRNLQSTKVSTDDVASRIDESMPQPLTETQFRALKETLRAQRDQEPVNSIQDGKVKAINGRVRGNIPFIANHSMQEYLKLISQHVRAN